MYSIWANIGLLVGAAVLVGVVGFFVYIIAKLVFEDFIGGVIGKIRRKVREKQDKDHYVY
jgi:hypothetical protein